GHGRERLRIDLRRAAGDDQLGARPLTPRLADRLPRLANRFAGHRAGVEHHRVGQAVLGRPRPDDLALVGVQPTPERDDVDVAHGSSPAKSTAAGPIMITWSSAFHSTKSSPPSTTMVAARSVRSRRAAATSAAQAPVP